MDILLFLLGATAIGVVGFATQRGGICTVQSIEELVVEGRAGRLVAMVEASIWVGAGLVLFEATGLLSEMPVGYRAGVSTMIGAVLLGLGAIVNRACAFGTIGRIGSGQWSYLAMPIGFVFGGIAAVRLFSPMRLEDESIVLRAASWLMVLCIPLLAGRLVLQGIAVRRKGVTSLRHIWSPHLATTVMGIAFLVASVTLGSWTYTDTLVGIARGNNVGVITDLLLACALLSGAVVGGWSGGTLAPTPPSRAAVTRCLAGGALMGAGASVIPGGSDGLILVGMPLLWIYAWVAFATMCVTVYIACRLGWRERA